MSLHYRFTTLEDGYFFLNQLKGLPGLPSSDLLRQRYVRACIIFSWLALEEVGKYVDSKRAHLVPREKLIGRLMRLLGSSQPHNFASEFTRLRTIRNDVAHANSHDMLIVSLSTRDASDVFTFCASVALAILPGLEWR